MRHVHLKIKIVSFCGVPVGGKNKDMTLVQYRYGTPKKIELKYPEEAMSPEGIFLKLIARVVLLVVQMRKIKCVARMELNVLLL
ncbi:TPA: hypothetical protein ACSP1O_004063 [Aeromonas veronii]